MRINPKTERQFKKRQDGLYQEFHYQIIELDYGNGKVERKIDRVIPGGIYREGTIHEHSIHGEAEIIDEGGIARRLIALQVPVDR